MAKRKSSSARTPVTHGYPRPQLQRDNWTSLNGRWDFAFDPEASVVSPRDVDYTETITVPFTPETPLSGIENTGFYKAVWYRRQLDVPALNEDQRLILHFGAVDHQATVWVNNALVATHEGGYTPFSVDITDELSGGKATLIVRAYDDPQDLAKPRGKQDWRLEPHAIWYPRTTGIWQTVWTEVVSPTRIESVHWTPDVATWSIRLRVRIAGSLHHNMRLRVVLTAAEGKLLAADTFHVTSDTLERTIQLDDPGIDDLRNELLWAPWSPNLIQARLELTEADDTEVDRVKSYTAMRSVSVQGDRLVMNGRPMMLRFLLDQGYWRESGLTAPSDEALIRDIELVKQLGFNGVRKHQKIEDPRFLFHADRLGLLVWEEMPSPYKFSPEAIRRLIAEWTAAINRDSSHPCIIAWVPFNESWGVPDLPDVRAQRDFVSGVYHLTKALDPTRPVIGNDGWEMENTDIVAIHDYERNPDKVRERYLRSLESMEQLFAYERPGNKQLLLNGRSYDGSPIMLTEFGGIAFHKDTKHTWGYKRATTAAEFEKQYTELLAAVRAMPMFSGFCYTQFTDTYQEANGLVYMDRTPKLPVDRIAKANSG
ncbi:MAG TPA: glycoside hydrolase family 2 TIM barrel-domain containing protein [Tepidisphaeraceae bacterium]|jgi:beta-galactosidase/beta-glucuronidase